MSTPSRPGEAGGVSRLVTVVYSAGQLLPVLLMLAYILGSLLFTGGRVLPTGHEMWGSALAFPVFIVADWFVLATAVLGAVLVVPLVASTEAAQVGQLTSAFSFTLGAAVAGYFFASVFPATTGVFLEDDRPPSYLGAHWIGAAVAVGCAMILVTRIFVLTPEYNRLRDAGQLPTGYR